MEHLKILLTTIAMLLSYVSANAEMVKVGELWYDIDKVNNTAEIIQKQDPVWDDIKGMYLYYDGNIIIPDSIEYDNNKHIDPHYYILSKVSYANKDKIDNKLDFITDLKKNRIGNRHFKLKLWHIWQHFFKPYEYNIEGEFRLLAFADEFDLTICNYDCKWFTTLDGICAPFLQVPLKTNNKEILEYPLTIKGIVLGCKFNKKEVNRISLEYKINDEYKDYIHKDFRVTISEINNYR